MYFKIEACFVEGVIVVVQNVEAGLAKLVGDGSNAEPLSDVLIADAV